LFSFQRSEAKTPPAARKPMESSNGPVDPRAPNMLTIEVNYVQIN
jgi:hypothetical protein